MNTFNVRITIQGDFVRADKVYANGAINNLYHSSRPRTPFQTPQTIEANVKDYVEFNYGKKNKINYLETVIKEAA